MHTVSKRVLIFLILITSILPPFPIDEHAPSMPSMVLGLSASVASVQLTITIFLLTMSICQLFAGPLSDRFGRRIILMPGLGISLIGSLICCFAPSIGVVLLGRAIQGFGMGAAAVAFTAITVDSFKGKDLVRVTSYVVMLYSMVPIVAPIIGGYIQEYFNWRTNFMFQFIMTLAVGLIPFFKLPETHTPTHEHSLHPTQLAKNYRTLLSIPSYVGSIIGGVFTWSMVIAFSVLAPFLFETTMKLSPAQYGHTALLIGVAFTLGSMLNTHLLKTHSSNSILVFGLCGSLIGSLAMLACPLLGYTNIWFVIIPAFFVITAVGITFTNFFAFALGAFPALAGIATSLTQCCVVLGAVILTALLTFLKAHSIYALAGTYVVLSIFSFLAFGLAQKSNIRNKS